MSHHEQTQLFTIVNLREGVIQMSQSPSITSDLCRGCIDRIKKGQPLGCADCEKKLRIR